MDSSSSKETCANATSRKDALMPLLLPSLLGIALCILGLCGSTWAWFTASSSSEIAPIEAATYDVSVKVEDAGGNEVRANEAGTYDLLGNTAYTITLRSTGTATTGYCKIVTPGETLYTAQIAQGKSLPFTLIPTSSGAVSFDAQWGTYSGKPTIEAKGRIGRIKPTAKSAPAEKAPSVSGEAKPDIGSNEPEAETNGTPN